MHVKQVISHFGCVAAMLWVALAAGCKDDWAADNSMDPKPIVEDQPDAEPPRIQFPPEARQEDASLNAEIEQVLKVCEQGDYDGFCKRFGIAEVPPSYDEFKRIWHGVREISIQSVHAGREDPLEYFVHAVIKLRQEDNQKRTQRDIVVRVFKEMGEWRISGASKDAVRKVLMADTQPAPGSTAEPAVGAGGETPAPSTAPAVYNSKSL